MKKNLMFSAAVISAASITIMSMPVFAEEQPVVVSGKTDISKDVDEVSEKTKLESNYSVLKGTIKTITTNDDGSVKIEFNSTQTGDIIFNESSGDCIVINGLAIADFTEIKDGAEVTVILDNNAPMALSYPGQTSGAVAFILNSDKSVEVDKFDDNLVGSKIAIKIGENTKIIDIRGTKQKLSEEDLKGHECLVIYGVATKSIPAQTTPDLVVVLDNADTNSETEPEEDSKEVALRKTLEEMGYKIEWVANDKPITISNGTIKASVTIGSKAVTFEDEVVVLPSEITIVDGVTYAPSEIAGLF